MRGISLRDGQKLILVTVGLADPKEQENLENIRASLHKQLPAELLNQAKIYHLRGRIDYRKLSLGHRSMMALLYQSLRRNTAKMQFAENRALSGTMPLAFTLYGLFAYSLIAALFLLIRKQMDGNRILQGLKYGLACYVVWTVYLWEPLPHVAPLDKITYPIADSLALVVMGLLLGWLFGNTRRPVINRKIGCPTVPVLVVIGCFLTGRIIQYLTVDIYSSEFVGRVRNRLCYGVAEPIYRRNQSRKAGAGTGSSAIWGGFNPL